MDEVNIVWSDCIRYRLQLRGFDLEAVEYVVRHSGERYVDTVTGRFVAVGRHGEQLIVVPYECSEGTLTPVTVHVTTRQQVAFRVKSGRFAYE
jgi:hypothetical protein